MTTFTRTTQTEDETTGLVTATTTTITGNAIRVRGSPETYRALGLIDSEAPTLLFTPDLYDSANRPAPGDTVVWESLTWTVRDVNPVAPDGITIIARVVITR